MSKRDIITLFILGLHICIQKPLLKRMSQQTKHEWNHRRSRNILSSGRIFNVLKYIFQLSMVNNSYNSCDCKCKHASHIAFCRREGNYSIYNTLPISFKQDALFKKDLKKFIIRKCLYTVEQFYDLVHEIVA